MPDKILRVLRWTCLLLAGTICWQVYGLVTVPEPFDQFGDLALEDLTIEPPPPVETTEEATEKAADDRTTESTDKTTESTDKTTESTDKTTESTDKTTESTSKETTDGKSAPPTPPGQNAGKPEGGGPEKKNDQKDAVSPPFPAALEIVATSGILGKAPEKKLLPPTLLGTLGKYAMIRSPDGKEDLVAEGGVLGGVKVIKISTNRALIEYQDRQTELTVYEGMGSPTLLPEKKNPEEKEKEKEKENNAASKDAEKTPEQKHEGEAPQKPATTDSPDSTPPNATQETS